MNNCHTHTHTQSERYVKHDTDDLVKDRQNVEEE